VHRMRRLLFLSSAIVFFDTLFFTALTPLLPHYAHALDLGKTGAGVLAAAYPVGTLVGAIPSGIVAARLGVKPTVLGGLICVATCTILFGIGNAAWELDTARFVQGLASSFSWTGALAWLVAGTPRSRRGQTIGTSFAFAAGGALFGPVLGAVASQAGIRTTFIVIGAASLGLALWAATTPSERPDNPQPLRMLGAAFRDGEIMLGFWFVVLPGLLFGTLSVLAPLRMSKLGFGAVPIGGAFLLAAAAETIANPIIGRLSDRHGPATPLRAGLVGSLIVAALLPWPDNRFEVAVLVVVGGLAFGSFFTPGMTMMSNAGERIGLDYGYAFALVSLAWAPGEAGGAAGGGALAHATSDTVPYLILAGVCALTLAARWRRRTSTDWTVLSVQASSAPSQPTTGDG